MLVSKKALFLLLISFIGGKFAVSQEMYGYVNSNYAGISGIQINPTSIVNSRLYFDVNLIGMHINADNNFIYLSKNDYNFTNFLSSNPQFPEHDVRVSSTRVERRIYYDYFNEDLKNAFGMVKIMGPSFMYSRNDKAIGISTSIRNIASAHDVPYELAKFGAEGFDYFPLHRINFIDNRPFRAGALSFAEISATYAQVIYKQNRDHLTAGITLKGLLGLGGAYWYVDNIDYMLPNGDTLIVYDANGSAGVSLPIDYQNNDVLFPNPLFMGSGIGADIGVTYQLKINGHTNRRYEACEQPFEDYYYKIGVSLIDFGYVKFKKNTRQIELKDASGIWYDFTNQDIGTVDTLFMAVSGTFGPDSNALVNNNEFKVYLPAAASVQFDYRVNPKLYINASLVYALHPNIYTLNRPVTLSVTPRIEKDNFELALPITLYNYTSPRVGLAARFSKFVIGTDKLGGLFGFSNFTGLDIYFMVKLSLIKGNCLGKGTARCSNMEFRQYQREQKKLKVR